MEENDLKQEKIPFRKGSGFFPELRRVLRAWSWR